MPLVVQGAASHTIHDVGSPHDRIYDISYQLEQGYGGKRSISRVPSSTVDDESPIFKFGLCQIGVKKCELALATMMQSLVFP